MKIWNVSQGSAEWLKLRSGLPTSSEFSNIVTPGGKLSTSADGYMAALLAEWMVGHPFEGVETKWMERGAVLEAEAVKAYEFQSDCDTEVVGFITNDAGTIGASPDRLVGDDRLLEIKCPAPHTHALYMLTGAIEQKYTPQIQGQLWISGRSAVDIVSYHPELPSVIITVARDEEYIAALSYAVEGFVERMAEKRALLEHKYGPFVRPEKHAEANPFEVTESDLDLIWADVEARRALEINS